MADISYLKNADTFIVADACRQYGAVAFIGEGLTELQKLEILSAAVQDLNQKLCNSEMFFSTSIKSDDSYESVTYAISDFNSSMNYVRIEKIIRYRQFHHSIPRRADKTEQGPLVPREKAQALVDTMNAQ